MCVATGSGFEQVLELDAPAFDALEQSIAERWPVELELAAVIAELQSAQLHAFVAAHTSKKDRVKLPPILQVPRPRDRTTSRTAAPATTSTSSSSSARRVSPAEFAGMFRKRVEVAERG